MSQPAPTNQPLSDRKKLGRPENKSAGRQKWIDIAWKMIGRGAFEPVRIEPLAKALGITKGSFYWYFKDRQELVDALVDRWLDQWALPDDVMALDDPGERLWCMVERVIRRPNRGAGVAFRYLSHDNPAIAERASRADQERFQLIRDHLVELGFPEQEAAVRAQLYQYFISGEFLRHGGEDVEQRLKNAREQHDLLIRRP